MLQLRELNFPITLMNAAGDYRSNHYRVELLLPASLFMPGRVKPRKNTPGVLSRPLPPSLTARALI